MVDKNSDGIFARIGKWVLILMRHHDLTQEEQTCWVYLKGDIRNLEAIIEDQCREISRLEDALIDATQLARQRKNIISRLGDEVINSNQLFRQEENVTAMLEEEIERLKASYGEKRRKLDGYRK